MTRLLFLAPATLGLFACATHPDHFARYEPTGQEDVWTHGTRLHTSEAPGLKVSSGFVGKSLESVKVDTTWTSPIRLTVRVANTGDRSVLIEPTRFRLWSPEASRVFRGIDPEKVIRNTEMSMVAQQDSHAASQGVSAILSLANLVGEVSADDPQTRDEFRKNNEELREMDRDGREQHYRRLAESGRTRDQWSELSLRKTTLFPGKEVHGLVNFVDDGPLPRPDTLLLQYEIQPGQFQELGRYAKLVDSVALLEKQRRKEEQSRFIRSDGLYYP